MCTDRTPRDRDRIRHERRQITSSGHHRNRNGVRELQDRQSDMSLNVDNMPYEELSALGERIGDVNTGLAEKTVMETMQQTKYQSITEGSPSNLKTCCICQEDCVDGDDVGTLDCGHDFHTNCIKRWLKQKNTCPICKMTALATCGKSTVSSEPESSTCQ